MSERPSKKAVKRRVKSAESLQRSLVALVDGCDSMAEQMKKHGFDPGDVLVFRDLILDKLHGAEEELSDACTEATLRGLQVHVRTRQPIALMRAEYQREHPDAT